VSVLVNLETLANKLQRRTEWQKTPDTLYLEDYCEIVLVALKQLYIVTGRASLYDESKLTIEDDMPIAYDDTLMLDEIEWIMVTAEIGFFRKVQTDVNNAFGYSTDALTVTNADKPYANLSSTIQKLENMQRIIYYKMTRFTLL
jgi:hypothetical protein